MSREPSSHLPRRLGMSLAMLSTLLFAGCTPGADTEAGATHHHAAQEKHGDSSERVRKNARTLTPKERADYVKAVLKLKKVPSPYTQGLSYYDQFVVWHRSLYACDPSMPPGAMPMPHAGPLFLPWHRQ
ncbi:MAG TPA: hypothetical protein VEU33_48385, partial [Archangium sp.]|nr:hypothetical protein [Archangium sp.]